MWYVMWLQSHASSLSKENQKKRNIKSRKIDKEKKNVSVQAHHNINSRNNKRTQQEVLSDWTTTYTNYT